MQTQTALQSDRRMAAPERSSSCRIVSIDELATARRRRERPDADAPALRRRCVHSGHLDAGASCDASVPAQVVASAWQRERLEHLLHDGFFRFEWRGEVWLGYGLADGGVRGVYCPEHNARRSERYYRQSDLAGDAARNLRLSTV